MVKKKESDSLPHWVADDGCSLDMKLLLAAAFFPCFLLLHLQIYEIILVFIVIIVKTGGVIFVFYDFLHKKISQRHDFILKMSLFLNEEWRMKNEE